MPDHAPHEARRRESYEHARWLPRPIIVPGRQELRLDFRQHVQMSEDQFADLVTQAKAGALDRLTASPV
ncbi:hypothetical protein ACGF4C_26885 [Streptomyces sp. NPDC048197]|uniref:hypothetical protein n=1 Tax=Streptomyces sp. NPDC048197 TaxID=3365511 RepID=UPI003710BE87